jgi:hypothetical protein
VTASTSSNRASSMHLSWVPPDAGPLVAVAATLTVVEPPVVPRLLLGDPALRRLGPAPRRRPPRPAVAPAASGIDRRQLGGYAPPAASCGQRTPPPSARGNPNTCDTRAPGRPPVAHQRRRRRWSGAVDDTEIRRLLARSGSPARDVVRGVRLLRPPQRRRPLERPRGHHGRGRHRGRSSAPTTRPTPTAGAPTRPPAATVTASCRSRTPPATSTPVRSSVWSEPLLAAAAAFRGLRLAVWGPAGGRYPQARPSLGRFSTDIPPRCRRTGPRCRARCRSRR